MRPQVESRLEAVRSSQPQLRQQSYRSEWSIAQVLRPLGSRSEIFLMYLNAGLSGQKAP